MNDYEILIHNNPQLYLTYNNGYHEILDIQLSIGDSFQLNGQDVTVVGIVQPAEILKYKMCIRDRNRWDKSHLFLFVLFDIQIMYNV